MAQDEYEAQAEEFLRRSRLQLLIKRGVPPDMAPPWAKKGEPHGLKYRVQIHRQNCTPSRFRSCDIEFDFWGSFNDMQEGKKPTPYDVLATVSSEVTLPIDPDEVYRELGPMPSSQALQAAEFSKKLRWFFSKHEQEELQEIS